MSRRTINADSLGRRSLAIEIGDMPAQMRAAVDELIPEALNVMPPETGWLRIQYEDRSSPNRIEVGTQHNYDRVWITILPGWFDQEPADRLSSFHHEIGHVWLARLTAIFRAALDQYVKDESSRRFIDKMLHDAEERTVDRLADLLQQASSRIPPVEVPPRARAPQRRRSTR